MGCHLVQQQDRRGAEIAGEGAGIGKDQADQQRLLFAGGTVAGRHTLVGKNSIQISAVRADKCAACGHVAGAVRRKGFSQIVRDRIGGGQRQRRRGKGRDSGILCCGQFGDGAGAIGLDLRARLGHLAL